MKAILVIDEKPKTCEECRYSVKMGNNGHWFGEYCVLQSCGTDCNENGLDKYCPLKPMPERKNETRGILQRIRDSRFESGYYEEMIGMCKDEHAEGWNDCIDEILGEKE